MKSIEEIIEELDGGKLTPQQALEISAAHMLTQREKSTHERETLVGIEDDGYWYRNNTGLCCAIGALIPEGVYDPEMEGDDIGDILRAYPQKLSHLDGSDVELYLALQDCHDWSAVNEWPVKLREIADAFKLRWTECLEQLERDFIECIGAKEAV